MIQCNHSDFIVTEEKISNAIHELKNGKSDGDKGLISDHVKLAPRRFYSITVYFIVYSQEAWAYA